MADTEPKQLTFRFPESGEQMEFEFDDPSTQSLKDSVDSLKKTLGEGFGLEGNKDSWLKKLLKQSKKQKRPDGRPDGGDGDSETQGPKSRSGAFFGSIGEDIKNTAKDIIDSFTAPIMALPGAKSLSKAIKSARDFSPPTGGVEPKEKEIFDNDDSSKEIVNELEILGGDGVSSIVNELQSGFSCICRNTELIRESLARLIDARRGDKLEEKERRNEGKRIVNSQFLKNKEKDIPKPPPEDYQWSEEITSGVIGGAITATAAALFRGRGGRGLARLAGATPGLNRIPAVARAAENAREAATAARAARAATEATRAATHASPLATQARNLQAARNPIARNILPSGSGLGSRLLHGTPTTFESAGGVVRATAGRTGLLQRAGLGNITSKARAASHAQQSLRTSLGGSAKLTQQAMQGGRLGQAAAGGSKLARSALVAKNFIKSTGVGTLLMVPTDVLAWQVNAAEAEAGGRQAVGEMSAIHYEDVQVKDPITGEMVTKQKVIDTATNTVLVDPTVDLGGITQEERSARIAMKRTDAELAANEAKIVGLLQMALTSRNTDQGILGSDTAANQLMWAVHHLMKEREKIAARSMITDPGELEDLIRFHDESTIKKMIADIRGTTSWWEQQDRGYVADMEQAEGDISGWRAAKRAMEGPHGTIERAHRSEIRHTDELRKADQFGGLGALLTNIEQQTGKTIPQEQVTAFLTARSRLSEKLGMKLDAEGYRGATPEEEEEITNRALDIAGLKRPTMSASVGPTPGVVDQTIDSQNDLTASMGENMLASGQSSSPTLISAPQTTNAPVVNNNTIARPSVNDDIAIARAAMDASRSEMFA